MMFCEKCGQKLSDSAKFCSRCGTRQIPFIPSDNSNAKSIILDGRRTFVPAMCPNCNSHMTVDTLTKTARCNTCGTECLVQDAIKTLTVKGNVQVGNATINVNGTNTDALLQRVEIMLRDGDFSGAKTKCNTILDLEPTNAKVYVFLLMADLKCSRKSDLANQRDVFYSNQYYKKALEYGDNGLKAELEGYNKSILDKIQADYRRKVAEAEEKLRNPKPHDEVAFGKKERGTRLEQPLLWQVLSVQNGMALILCNTILQPYKPYHDPGTATTWKDCTLRGWLNNDFLTKYNYFTPSELERILSCKVMSDNNPIYGTQGGTQVIDRVFLLSIQEYKYFSQFGIPSTGKDFYRWWLRTPGKDLKHAAYVNGNGMISYEGHETLDCNYEDYYGARPAMWVKVN